VWEAGHSESDRHVAVKVFDQGSRDRRQAQREMRVLSRIQHPSVLRAFEVIESPNLAQLVCELVDGESLRAFAHRQLHNRLQVSVARHFYRQVVEGVRYCHGRFVVHRDLKLENLLLDKAAENVKIIDFGFAVQVASKDAKLRAFCGTPSYMAPEIIRGDSYSGFSTDVWALGVVVFALLVGSLPFIGRSEPQLYASIRRGVFTCPDCLGELPRRLVKSTLRMDSNNRPSASSLLQHPWVVGDDKPSTSGKDVIDAGSGARTPCCQTTENASTCESYQDPSFIGNTPPLGEKDAKTEFNIEARIGPLRPARCIPGTALGGS